MLTREQMLERIQEVFSDKTLSFGCRVKDILEDKYARIVVFIPKEKSENIYPINTLVLQFDNWNWFIQHLEDIKDFKDFYINIWHDIMIWRFISVLHNNWFNVAVWWNGKIMLNENKDWSYKEIIWEELEKSIDCQSDECIRYVYSLCDILDSKK